MCVMIKPTSWVPGADPVRVDDAGDGEDICSEEEASWDHGEFIHVGWRSSSQQRARVLFGSSSSSSSVLLLRQQQSPARPAGASPAREERLTARVVQAPHPGWRVGWGTLAEMVVFNLLIRSPAVITDSRVHSTCFLSLHAARTEASSVLCTHTHAGKQRTFLEL